MEDSCSAFNDEGRMCSVSILSFTHLVTLWYFSSLLPHTAPAINLFHIMHHLIVFISFCASSPQDCVLNLILSHISCANLIKALDLGH